MKTQNLFSTIGISPTHDKETIRRAIRRAKLCFHPDKTIPTGRLAPVDAHRAYECVINIESILSNDHLRGKYMYLLKHARHGHIAKAHGGINAPFPDIRAELDMKLPTLAPVNRRRSEVADAEESVEFKSYADLVLNT
jgi:DnaJ-class molecular chaperone